jgi:hypothetical protein
MQNKGKEMSRKRANWEKCIKKMKVLHWTVVSTKKKKCGTGLTMATKRSQNTYPHPSAMLHDCIVIF